MSRNSVAQLISCARIGLRDTLRRTAPRSIAPASAACERALGLLAMRDDDERGADAWLDAHVAASAPAARRERAQAAAPVVVEQTAPPEAPPSGDTARQRPSCSS